MLKPDSSRKRINRPPRAGSAMILMLVLLIIVVGMVAFAVDVGLMVLLRAELQNAVDAGALAGSLELQEDPNDVPAAEDAAREFVQLNRVGMTRLVPEDTIDVEQGLFDGETNTFTRPPSRPTPYASSPDRRISLSSSPGSLGRPFSGHPPKPSPAATHGRWIS